jgi:hypothetical protein
MRKLVLTLIVSMALGTVALVSRQFVPRSAASAPPTIQHPGHALCDECTGGGKKVTICHVAPGSGNEETITISCHALDAHLSHHDDYCGPCNGHTQH